MSMQMLSQLMQRGQPFGFSNSSPGQRIPTGRESATNRLSPEDALLQLFGINKTLSQSQGPGISGSQGAEALSRLARELQPTVDANRAMKDAQVVQQQAAAGLAQKQLMDAFAKGPQGAGLKDTFGQQQRFDDERVMSELAQRMARAQAKQAETSASAAQYGLDKEMNRDPSFLRNMIIDLFNKGMRNL